VLRQLGALIHTVHQQKALGYRSPREFREQFVERRPRTRSARRADRMEAQCPWMRSVKAGAAGAVALSARLDASVAVDQP
jgi:hypothetical protein